MPSSRNTMKNAGLFIALTVMALAALGAAAIGLYRLDANVVAPVRVHGEES